MNLKSKCVTRLFVLHRLYFDALIMKVVQHFSKTLLSSHWSEHCRRVFQHSHHWSIQIDGCNHIHHNFIRMGTWNDTYSLLNPIKSNLTLFFVLLLETIHQEQLNKVPWKSQILMFLITIRLIPRAHLCCPSNSLKRKPSPNTALSYHGEEFEETTLEDWP